MRSTCKLILFCCLLAVTAIGADITLLITSGANTNNLWLTYWRADGTNKNGMVSPAVLPQKISLSWNTRPGYYYIVRRSFTLDVHPFIQPSTGLTGGFYGAWEIISPRLTNGFYEFGENDPHGMFYRVEEFPMP